MPASIPRLRCRGFDPQANEDEKKGEAVPKVLRLGAFREEKRATWNMDFSTLH